MRQDRRPLGHYEKGRTPFYAAQADKRFSYCLGVPPDYADDDDRAYTLIVLVHGTERNPAAYRELFFDFAAAHDCILLVPLFPAGMTAPGELSSYKFIDDGGIRYDQILLSMVDEVAARYRLKSDRFLLYGFSGGGQFAHRMLCLHPRRLLGVSAGAPGLVTLPDPALRWWRGTADLEERFGVAFAPDAMRRVPVQLVIGDQDLEDWEIRLSGSSPYWMEGANDAGATRIERIETLYVALRDLGLDVQLDRVAGVAHVSAPVAPTVQAFMARVLASEGVGALGENCSDV